MKDDKISLLNLIKVILAEIEQFLNCSIAIKGIDLSNEFMCLRLSCDYNFCNQNYSTEVQTMIDFAETPIKTLDKQSLKLLLVATVANGMQPR